jgi:hypothetical protein
MRSPAKGWLALPGGELSLVELVILTDVEAARMAIAFIPTDRYSI